MKVHCLWGWIIITMGCCMAAVQSETMKQGRNKYYSPLLPLILVYSGCVRRQIAEILPQHSCLARGVFISAQGYSSGDVFTVLVKDTTCSSFSLACVTGRAVMLWILCVTRKLLSACQTKHIIIYIQ